MNPPRWSGSERCPPNRQFAVFRTEMRVGVEFVDKGSELEMDGLGAVRAVLLDMDGTLVDSDAAVERAWRQWCHVTGASPEVTLQVSPGKPSSSTVRHMFPSWDASAVFQSAQLQVGFQYEDLDDVTAAIGAAVLLETLRVLDVPWAVVTSADRRLAGARLRAADIAVPLVVTCQDVPRGKPHPDGYLLAAQELEASPERCLVVEDTEAGVIAGKEAGMLVAGLRGVGGDIPIDDLAQLARLLELSKDGDSEFGIDR